MVRMDMDTQLYNVYIQSPPFVLHSQRDTTEQNLRRARDFSKGSDPVRFRRLDQDHKLVTKLSLHGKDNRSSTERHDIENRFVWRSSQAHRLVREFLVHSSSLFAPRNESHRSTVRCFQ